ncbi:MAG: UbiD family decarboxylase [Rhizobiales bacterium]|nr:UbiD family decarboxylase [Hyphomicrobiales bacterium]
MAGIDLEQFRLRRFVEHLIAMGEVDIHDRPVALADMSAIIEGSTNATLFKDAGPEHFEIVGAVGGSRRRHTLAFGTSDERNLAQEFGRRMANMQPVVDVPQADAPVQQVVMAGDDVDLTKLPFHMQHTYDGAPYLSSAIDYTLDPKTGRRNVGCRRLMLRGKTTMLSNLTQMSDLKRMFLECVERGEHLHLNFAVGAHPLDFLAACVRAPVEDEFVTVASVRGAPLPMTRGVSNGLPVPADAELVIEGYFDKAGYTEIEGPYGEFLGYYGPAHVDPIFHVTAITMRKDVLHQTVLHGAVKIARTDHAHQCAILTEARIRHVLGAARIDPIAVYAVPSASGLLHARVSVRREAPGQARAVISSLFAIPFLKHVYVLDEDVDVFSDEEVEWAMANRFRADRDLVTATGQRAFPMDVTMSNDSTTTKAGFDLTGPLTRTGVEAKTTHAPHFEGSAHYKSVEQALGARPMYFAELMASLGSKDGREIAMELDRLRGHGALARSKDGEWVLKT